MSINGTFTAVVTPFSPNGRELDLDSFRSFLRFQVAGGVEGVVVCGSTGEGQVLSDEEYRLIVKTAVMELKGKLPVFAGIGTNSTEKAYLTAQILKDEGCDGALVVAPPYNKPPQRGLLFHYRRVAEAGLPVIAYNIPGRSAVNISAQTLHTLAHEGSIIAIKESSGSVDQVIDIQALLPDSVSMLSGEDSLTVSLIAAGAKGVIATTSNLLPNQMSAMVRSALGGDFVTAKRFLFELLPTIRMMFMDTNPIPVKAALAEAGIIASAAVRAPLMEPEPELRTKIKNAVAALRIKG